MLYVRYHVLSGEIDLYLTVVSEEDLNAHGLADHDFLQVGSHPQRHIYVNPKTKKLNTARKSDLVVEPIWRFTTEGFDVAAKEGVWLREESSGYTMVTDALVEYPAPGEPKFTNITTCGKDYGKVYQVTWFEEEDLKNKAITQVDNEAATLLESTSKLAATYAAKTEAARAFLGGDGMTEPQKLRLQNEALRSGLTTQEVAKIIVDKAEQAEIYELSVDNVRLVAKQAIREAKSGATIQSILAGVLWPRKLDN